MKKILNKDNFQATGKATGRATDKATGKAFRRSLGRAFSSFETGLYSRRIVWLVIALFAIGGMIDIPESTILPTSEVWTFVIIVVIAMFKATILTAFLIATRRISWLSTIAKISVAVYCVLCAINALSFWMYGMGITIKMMTILAQTNSAEVSEFLPSTAIILKKFFSSAYPYVGVLLIAGLVWIVKITGRKIFNLTALSLSIIGLIILILTFTLPAGRTNFSIPVRVVKSGVCAYREMSQIRDALDKITALPHPETVSSDRLADIVMVVGESASRGNLSLYGYEIPTTPKLDSIQEQLIIFDDVIGTSTITAFNMDRILTFLSDSDEPENWYRKPMLFSLMNEAGYHTAWISNQEKSGMWANSTVAMVSMASDIRFVGSISSDDATLMKFDGQLLPELNEVLTTGDDSKFVGLHLMGSHIEYRKRYPREFAVFNADSIRNHDVGKKLTRSQAATLAEYNNSLRYTDFILSEIIDMVSDLHRPTLLIYFSDHGENVYDEGEDYCGRDERHVEVPFIVYPNAAFRSQYPQIVERLRSVSHYPMTTASLTHLLCTLTGTSYASYDPTYDVLSNEYIPRPRYVDGKVWPYEATAP